jgi:hypothetical protein
VYARHHDLEFRRCIVELVPPPTPRSPDEFVEAQVGSPSDNGDFPSVHLNSENEADREKMQGFEEGIGYVLRLDGDYGKYRGMDGLRVRTQAFYTMPTSRPLDLIMSHPTNKATLTIEHPEDLKAVWSVFGVPKNEISEQSETRTLVKLFCVSWLLPDSGFCIGFVPHNEGVLSVI